MRHTCVSYGMQSVIFVYYFAKFIYILYIKHGNIQKGSLQAQVILFMQIEFVFIEKLMCDFSHNLTVITAEVKRQIGVYTLPAWSPTT